MAKPALKKIVPVGQKIAPPFVVLCKICNKKVGGGPAGFKQHIQGNKHKISLPDCITVKGLFDIAKIDEVHQGVQKFGAISEKNLVSNVGGYVTFQYRFGNKECCTDLIQNGLVVSNIKFGINWTKAWNTPVDPAKNDASQPKSADKSTPQVNGPQKSNLQHGPSAVHKPEKKPIDPEELKLQALEATKEPKEFDKQVQLLQRKLAGNVEETQKDLEQIRKDLYSQLIHKYRNYDVLLFGSSVTGLAYDGSDLDIFIWNVKQSFEDEIEVLKKIRNLLTRYNKFSETIIIPRAAVPIIKCVHTKTQIRCDINVRSSLGVSNSQLIKYYLSIDEKIKALMITVKYWFDVHELKKVSFFSAYSVYMLVIFYLQQEPYNLPSVMALQANVTPIIQDGWNSAFTALDSYSKILKEVSLKELFVGFVRYYADFDYTSLVVCPYWGRPLPKLAFFWPFNDLPCYEDYKRYATTETDKVLKLTPFYCIQDPFEHSRNVASSTSLVASGKFASLCTLALNYLSHLKTEQNLLFDLMTKFKKADLFNTVTFELLKTNPNVDDKWYESTQNFIIKVLKEVLRCEVTFLKEKMADPDSGGSELTGIVKIASQWNVWVNRVDIKKNLVTELPPNTDDLTYEIASSTCIVQYFPQPLKGKFHMGLFYKKNPDRIKIVALSGVANKQFSHCLHYLRINLPKWLKHLESEAHLEVAENSVSTPDGVSAENKDTTNMTGLSDNVNSNIKEVKNESRDNPPQNVDNTPKNSVKSPFEVEENKTEIQNEINSPKNDARKCSVEESKKQVNSENDSNVEESGGQAENADTSPPEEEEEEDVPADFFDDFNNEDFMLGLDIVDAWDEDGSATTEDKAEKSSKKKSITDVKDKRRKSTPTKGDAKDRDRKSMSSKDRSRKSTPGKEKGRKSTPSKGDTKERSRKGSSSRDDTRDKRRKSSEKHGKASSGKRGRSRSRSLTKRFKRDRSGSRGRRRSKSRSREFRRDPEKTKRDIHQDKIKVAKDMEFKLVSDKLNLVETGLVPPGTEMDVDLTTMTSLNTKQPVEKVEERRSRERRLRRSPSRERRRLSKSPHLHTKTNSRSKRRSGSINSNLSLRERWLRRKRSRSRSVSPRSRHRHEDKKKKKSFLEEIREKLNEVRPTPVVHYNPPAPIYINPVPAPVPAPAQYFQPANNQEVQQYDQSFFIGDSYLPKPSQPQSAYDPLLNSPIPPITPVPAPSVKISQVNSPVAQAAFNLSVQSSKINSSEQTQKAKTSLFPILTSPESKKVQERTASHADLGKLFTEKKISLSEFLTMNAKLEVSSSKPENVQKKIKVLLRCQDAIKAMGDERKYSGRLAVRSSMESLKGQEVKYQSPLRRIPIVRFQFTTPIKTTEEVDGFGVALDRILHKIGLIQETVNLDDYSDELPEKNPTAMTTRASLLTSSSKRSNSVPCEECEKRRRKVYTSVSSQCVETKETNSVAIQVNEEELSPVKGISKNDSLAHLTPAQLLGRGKEKEPMLATSVANEKAKISLLNETRENYRNLARGHSYDEFDIYGPDQGRPSREFLGPEPTMFPSRPVPPRPFDVGPPRLMPFRDDNGYPGFQEEQRFWPRNPNRDRFGPRF